MQPNTPCTLFKYRSNMPPEEEHKIFDILEGKLYFSTIDKFNDGFEYFYTFSEDKFINNNKNQIVKFSPMDQIKRFSLSIENIKQDAGYYCLSDSDVNLSMWALYANGHSGVCIGFEWDKLKGLDSAWVFAEQIEYRETPVDLDKHSGGEGWHKVFTSKPRDFSFEAEWRLRLNTPGSTTEDKKAVIQSSISQVIFGFKTTQDFRERVMKKCTKEEICPEFFITAPIAGQYALCKIKLDSKFSSEEIDIKRAIMI